jgi:Tol biopolymer transport system component
MPDGTAFVFPVDRPGPGPDLWRVKLAALDQPRLLNLASRAGGIDPAISRVGNRLAYVFWRRDSNIWRLTPGDPTGVEKTPALFNSTRYDVWPALSPDGTRVAFLSDRSGTREVWVCDTGSSDARRLTRDGGAWPVRWSPDGERLVFPSGAPGRRDIYMVNANGGTPQRITTDQPSGVGLPSWSRDGKWIYFASDRTGRREVWRIPAQGGEAVQITREGGTTALESPDGAFLYYAKGNGTTSLWKVPAEGGEETQIIASVRHTAFAVIDKGIYFIPGDGRSIHLFDFQTGKARRFATFEKPIRFEISVSRDANLILYSQYDQLDADIMLVENFR